ncbi:MAG TPA: glycoside hydrolase family 2 TIM barrel-domain containing protein [Jatrophihabitantaceae bacterium]
MTEQNEPHRRAGRLSRRQFISASGAGAAALAAWSVLGSRPPSAEAAPPSGPAARVLPFNAGWLFGESAPGSDQPSFDDRDLVTVTLPHTVAPLSWRNWDPSSWEQVWVYRKHFDAPADVAGLRVFLDFAAALTRSTVTLNGNQVGDHLGGYLPFSCEITDHVQPHGNVLAVTLDSTFNLDVPPDRPAPAASTSVDYWQPGGIYRDVRLRAVPQVFLADVFAKPQNVLDPATREVAVQCTVDAAVVPNGSAQLEVELLDGARPVATTTVPAPITATGQTTISATLAGLDRITLWDVDAPHLYTVVATLVVNGAPLHDYRVRIGFREAKFTLDGFFLNGRRLKLFGVNRHQFFPFAGGAMPERVQRRDAEILRRDLNCTFVRCSHYPQSEAFYDACDELGLMVWEEIPGWGFFGDAAWQALAQRDVQDMIVRDRNHPAIIVWGAMPNESGNHVPQYTAWNALAHSLDDSRPTGGDDNGFGGGAAGFEFDVFSHHDYSHHTGSDGQQVPDLSPPTDAAGKPYLVCEAVGTLSGPAKFYRRTDSQMAQQGQATAHARVHDIAYSDDRYCGLAAWSGYDYESGSGNIFQSIKFTGVIDLFRVPKPGAAIYQSQVDPRIRPVIAPAFYWDFGPTSPIDRLGSAMICANLDRLEVYVGGAHFATAMPDASDYGHLPYPPSFVDFSGVDGSTRPELRIDGYLGDAKVISRSFSSDPGTDVLSAHADDPVLAADGVDATRVEFRAVDKYGAPRPYVSGQVTLSVDGPGVLVGDNPFAFGDAGGVGAVWVRTLADSPGVIRVRAAHPDLGAADVAIQVRQQAPGGPPQPYGEFGLQASPDVLMAGDSTEVTATFTNRGNPDLNQVSVELQVLDGWTAQALTPSTFRGVDSGQTVQARWRVSVPPGTTPGASTLSAEAVYTHGPDRGVSKASSVVSVAYPSLAAAFDNAGISDDSDVTTADFDGVGNSYSKQALAAAGLTPGGRVTHDGIAFTWPDTSPGQPDNAVGQGQVVLVSGSGATLGLLGAGSPSNIGGSGTVYYTDGTTSNYTATLDNYFSPPGPENDAVATMPYLNDSNPASNGGVAGQRQHTVFVFYAGVPIDAGKTVRAVSLPPGGVVPPTGRITGMHVFAIGIG